MNLQEAIKDPSRPISISPHDWMRNATQDLDNQEKQENIIISAKKEKSTNDEDGISMIDNALDLIVQGITMAYEGLGLTKRADLPQNNRKILEKIQDLLDNAVGIYTADIIEQLDLLENDDDK